MGVDDSFACKKGVLHIRLKPLLQSLCGNLRRTFTTIAACALCALAALRLSVAGVPPSRLIDVNLVSAGNFDVDYDDDWLRDGDARGGGGVHVLAARVAAAAAAGENEAARALRRRGLLRAGAPLKATTAVARGDEPLDAEQAPGWWRARYNELCAETGRLRREDAVVDVLFVGDSIIQMWPQMAPKLWKGFFDFGMTVVNFGISFDRTQHALYRIRNDPSLPHLRAKVVVVLIGST
jgi:hypothetical protein